VVLVAGMLRRGEAAGVRLGWPRCMRMGMRRFTRLTNGFSKKVENLANAVSLHYMHYNLARSHKSLGEGVTPAMPAGKAEHPWTVWDIAGLLN